MFRFPKECLSARGFHNTILTYLLKNLNFPLVQQQIQKGDWYASLFFIFLIYQSLTHGFTFDLFFTSSNNYTSSKYYPIYSIILFAFSMFQISQNNILILENRFRIIVDLQMIISEKQHFYCLFLEKLVTTIKRNQHDKHLLYQSNYQVYRIEEKGGTFLWIRRILPPQSQNIQLIVQREEIFLKGQKDALQEYYKELVKSVSNVFVKIIRLQIQINIEKIKFQIQGINDDKIIQPKTIKYWTDQIFEKYKLQSIKDIFHELNPNNSTIQSSTIKQKEKTKQRIKFKKLRYQSMTDFLQNSNIFVVYKNRRAYPLYLITY